MSGPVEVPRDDWPLFLDAFSRQHRGWRVTLVVGEGPAGRSVLATLPLAGITFEPGRREAVVTLGDAPEDHVSHAIADPARVTLDRGGVEEGRGETLRIEAPDGRALEVRVEAPVLPEQLDGLA